MKLSEEVAAICFDEGLDVSLCIVGLNFFNVTDF